MLADPSWPCGVAQQPLPTSLGIPVLPTYCYTWSSMGDSWGVTTLWDGVHKRFGFVSLLLFLFQEMRKCASSDATYICN